MAYYGSYPDLDKCVAALRFVWDNLYVVLWVWPLFLLIWSME